MSLQRFVKEFLRAFSIGVGLFIIFGLIEYFNGVRYQFDQKLLMDFVYHQIYSVAIYMANMGVIFYMMRKYELRLYTFRRLSIAMLYSVLATMLTLFLLNTFVIMFRFERTFTESLALQDFEDYWPSLLVAIVITLVFYLLFYYKHRQDTRVKEQKIIARTASAQFDALKNQLDPHFLFNSLNVLTSLIEEDPRQAQKFTTSLSKVYRYVLEQKNKELVTVDEELKFARTYVGLLKMRFEESIIFNIPERASNPEARVVPLSLQLLLENAVKHNSVTPNKPLQITIEEVDGQLQVRNNLQPKQVVKKGSGVGLRNIQQRYAILSNKPVSIQKTATEFIVRIPMLTRQVSTVVKKQETYLEDKRYLRAKERVDALKNFYGNLTAYCVVIPVLWFINYQTTSFIWAIFPTLGWGFGVLMHWMEASGKNPFMGRNWERRKIKEFMDEDDF